MNATMSSEQLGEMIDGIVARYRALHEHRDDVTLRVQIYETIVPLQHALAEALAPDPADATREHAHQLFALPRRSDPRRFEGLVRDRWEVWT